jgi:galactose mutarotase-like enzyme
MPLRSFLLTDHQTRQHIEAFDFGEAGWSIRKRTLRGGLSDGVEIVEVDNGALSFTVLPTRGMGLWKGKYKDIDLGWSAPVRGPVHPKFVDLSFRGGLGWLTGFDEWLCRCGLAWNGPPGDDGGFPLTLHGRVANQPVHRLEVQLDSERNMIRIAGEVEESGLFFPRLSLRTVYSTVVGSNRIEIEDTVTNESSQPTEMQLLYHLNFGPPLLGPGSQIHVPINHVWPSTERAAESIDEWNRYGRPTSGFREQVYLIRPQADSAGNTLAVLHGGAKSRGVVLRWNLSSLPYFTMWKNTGALEDGYVTGLEPATAFPRFRAQERAAGRVRVLKPGETWSARWTIEVLDQAEQIDGVLAEITQIQSTSPAQIHRTPLP